MKCRTRITFLCTIGILLAAGLLAIAEPKSSPQPRPYKPVQSIEQMMEGQKRLFDDIKEAIGAKEWDEAATSAWILAEVANANRYQREDPAYQDFAEQVSTQCKQLAQLATKRDDASSRAAVNTIGKTCNACHEQFQKKKP